jgi:Mn-containing catalase
MMQYLFQNFNFRGKAKPYQDLIKSVAGEEIGISINMLLEGTTENAPPNEIPLSPALGAANIHHFLVGAQSAMPVDSRKSLVWIICI